MFSNRIIPFLFLVATFGLFAFAAPTSSVIESSLLARCDTCTCTTSGCNEAAILNIVTNLQATIKTSTSFLDGVTAPGPYADDICTAIKDSITLLAAVDVNDSTAGADVGDIVNIVVAIILAIATCVSKYGASTALSLAQQFDASLSDLIKALINLIPGVTALFEPALNVDLDVLQAVKFVLTLAACNLPCGC
ncbi:hypothetical protein FIBSPDRAFT_884815 [Athelia psychrophila]|uniref:Uncharacterized protein n=1 Tax=Athelia psychrophila TaxID=1759441 RepID=A0A166ST66_9AGAM|nr:hypothetical protein FIBSPDRAFT_884815 [Fibularhizoctonia sp. CBS 109695]